MPHLNPTLATCRRRLRLLLGAALFAGVGSCLAEGPTNLQFSGFGTLGISHMDAPDGWVFTRDLSQARNSRDTRPDLDSRLGLQLNYAPDPKLELVGQVIATRRSAVARDSDAIEWAFAAWRPDADWTLRAGRVNLDAFLLSDHRSVGFAYPFARPPVDFYTQLPTSMDGVDLTRVWDGPNAQWRAKLFTGQASVFVTEVDRMKIKPLVGAMVSRESGGLLLRASVFHARFDNEIAVASGILNGLDQISAVPLPQIQTDVMELRRRTRTQGETATYLALGARYESKDWLISSEYTRLRANALGSFQAGYVSVGRRMGAWTLYTVASRVQSSESAVTAPQWAALVAPLGGPMLASQAQLLADGAANYINKSRIVQHTVSLGTRWDLSPRVALKLQWDRINVDADGNRAWGIGISKRDATVNVGTALLDFVF